MMPSISMGLGNFLLSPQEQVLDFSGGKVLFCLAFLHTCGKQPSRWLAVVSASWYACLGVIPPVQCRLHLKNRMRQK